MRDLQGWRVRGKCQSLINMATSRDELLRAYQKLDKLFFYGSGGSPVRGKRFCATCPVKQQCRDYAILYEEVGLWGGTDDKERDMIRRMMPEYVALLRKEAMENRRLEIRESVNALGLRAAQTYQVVVEVYGSDPLEDVEGPNLSQFLVETSLYTQQSTDSLVEVDWWQTVDYIVCTSSQKNGQDSTANAEMPQPLIQRQTA